MKRICWLPVIVFGLLVACEEPNSGGSATRGEDDRVERRDLGVEIRPASHLVTTAGGTARPLDQLDLASAKDLLRELRASRNNKVDALYEDYGKGEWRKLGERVVEHTVGETEKTLTQGASQPGKLLVGEMMDLVDEAADNALADLERDVFQTYVVEVGEGKRTSALDDHTRQFFSGPNIQQRCREIATISDQLSKLEKLLMKERVLSRP